MWVVKTFSGQTFTLDDKQKEFYLQKVNDGAKVIVFDGFILSPTFEYIISETQEHIEKLRSNPILNDEDFLRYLEGSSPAADTLDRRYPCPKYQSAWDEAHKNKSYAYSLQKVSSNGEDEYNNS